MIIYKIALMLHFFVPNIQVVKEFSRFLRRLYIYKIYKLITMNKYITNYNIQFKQMNMASNPSVVWEVDATTTMSK